MTNLSSYSENVSTGSYVHAATYMQLAGSALAAMYQHVCGKSYSYLYWDVDSSVTITCLELAGVVVKLAFVIKVHMQMYIYRGNSEAILV